MSKNSDGIQLVYDEENGVWKEKEEPFAVIEIKNEEELNLLKAMIDFWNEHHKNEHEDGGTAQ